MEPEQNNVNVGVEEGGGSSGPIIGAVVILAIVVLGGLYFWGQRAGNETVNEAVVDEINMQSNSDETASIEADLDATDIENIDADLNVSY